MPLTKNYLMAFHSCLQSSCSIGPSAHTVQLAESNDGLMWNLVSGFPSYSGSVPDVITRNNKLYIYTPGKVKRYNTITSTWDAVPVNVSIVDASSVAVSYVDPSPYTDASGALNLFFLNSTGIVGDPAICTTTPCIRTFDSATEVPGSDGTQFIKQPGSRITVTVTGGFAPTDPDIFYDGVNYFLYTSEGTTTRCYSSSSLHGTYTALSSLPSANLLSSSSGIPCGIYNTTTLKYMSYGHSAASGSTEIKGAVHSNFLTQPTYSTLITGTSIGLGSTYNVQSPGICNNTFLTLGLKNITSSKILNVFPNPAENFIYINLPQTNDFEVIIKNSLGIEIIKDIPSNQKIDISELNSGIYFVSVINSKSHELLTSRFIKN